MDGETRGAIDYFPSNAAPINAPIALGAQFVAEEFRQLEDAAERRARIADLVVGEIAPRLSALHVAVQPPGHPTPENIAELARLVLGSEGQEAARYVTELKRRGLSVDLLFAELLEPAEQLLGRLWDEDEVDFIDVTLGVGRLQALLSVFNCTHEVGTSNVWRTVLMLTVPGEQHTFGATMVEQFLEAGGWRVTSHREASPVSLCELVRGEFFAVAGITLSNRCNLDKASDAIATIREHSCNTNIGVMVGGPLFSADPRFAAAIGADGTAAGAATAVVLAQKLFDRASASAASDLAWRDEMIYGSKAVDGSGAQSSLAGSGAGLVAAPSGRAL